MMNCQIYATLSTLFLVYMLLHNFFECKRLTRMFLFYWGNIYLSMKLATYVSVKDQVSWSSSTWVLTPQLVVLHLWILTELSIVASFDEKMSSVLLKIHKGLYVCVYELQEMCMRWQNYFLRFRQQSPLVGGEYGGVWFLWKLSHPQRITYKKRRCFCPIYTHCVGALGVGGSYWCIADKLQILVPPLPFFSPLHPFPLLMLFFFSSSFFSL